MTGILRTRLAALLAALVAAPCANAQITGDWTSFRKITEVFVYPDLGGGDVVVRTDPADQANCPGGYWLSPSSPGFKQTYANVLTAMHTDRRVLVWSHIDQRWSGSAAAICKHYSISVRVP